VRGALFMPCQNEFDRRIDQGVKDWDGSATWMPKDVLDPLLFHAMDQGFGSGTDFFWHILTHFFKKDG
jgi:hypothetical protein